MDKYKVIVSLNGAVSRYLNGILHSESDPAVTYPNGDLYWYANGKLHREDGPAIEYADGSKWWYVNGRCKSVKYSFDREGM